MAAAFLFGNLSVFAQTGRGAGNADAPKTASNQKTEKSCNSGCSGSVTYTSMLTKSYTDPKTSSTGSRKRVFTVNVPIRDDGRQTDSVTRSPYDGRFKARATANLSDSDVETTKSAGNEVCTVTMAGTTKEKYVSCQGVRNWQGSGDGRRRSHGLYRSGL